MATDARILLNSDGTWADANEAALETLGVETLDALKRLPSDAFAATPSNPEEGAAFRAAWTAQGAGPIVGETTLRRADGQTVPVKFLIAPQPDGRYLAVLRRSAGATSTTRVFVSAGQALSAWRAAQRRLETLVPEDPEWATAQLEVEQFRHEYRRLFDLTRGSVP